MSTLRLYITFDVDQDESCLADQRTSLTWNGLNLIPEMNSFLKGLSLKHTCFVRCDNQIQDVYGSSLFLLREYGRIWDALLSEGNELAWHPHLYQRVNNDYRPMRDPAIGADILRACWEDLRQVDYQITTVRLGEAWHSNETMAACDACGLTVDSTAVPGRRRDDASRQFDWLPTPNRPYYPDRHDYRVPGTQSALRILEVPMTTALVQTSYDKHAIPRYLNPTFHPPLFRMAVENWLTARAADDMDLVLIFHPDELLPRPSNQLHAFGFDAFRTNIERLLDLLDLGGLSVQPCCLGTAAV